jgi:hypothetical protein
MCETCEEISIEIPITHPYEYFNLVSQIKNHLTDGLLELVSGNCDFEDIDKSKPFSDDFISHS